MPEASHYLATDVLQCGCFSSLNFLYRSVFSVVTGLVMSKSREQPIKGSTPRFVSFYGKPKLLAHFNHYGCRKLELVVTTFWFCKMF